MPKRDGISLAREIRKKGDETMVIYTSSTTEYAMDALESMHWDICQSRSSIQN